MGGNVVNTNPFEPISNPTKSFYDRISNAYDLIADSSEHTAREKGLEMLAVSAGETVLVVGFGTGHALVTLGRAVGTEGKVFGIDISEGMAAVARKRITDEGVVDRVELFVDDARKLPYADNSFGAAFIAFTLELFDDADLPRVLEQIRHVLRPGGRLAVVSMSKDEHESVTSEIYVWMHRHFPHFVDCRPIDVSLRLNRAGFQLNRLETMSIWGLPVAIALARKPDVTVPRS
jgi:demethylmenaquinone methyltransferase/2-methoxy-6-polyprenyl-1,4-benzoquinol methylase